MNAGRTCNECGDELVEKDWNERISLVPQIIQGLWPIILDTQDQLDFCDPDCAAKWFEGARKDRPALLKAESDRDAAITSKALDEAEKRQELYRRLTEIGEQEKLHVGDESAKEIMRGIEQERHRLVRELNELGQASAPAGVVAGSRGPRGRSGKTSTRR